MDRGFLIRRWWRGVGAVVVYLALAGVGLVVGMVGCDVGVGGRGFWVEFGVGLGFVGIAMMGLQFVLTARFPSLSGRYGQDTLLWFHRYVGLLAACCVLGHAGVLIAAEPGYASFFDPRVNLPRACALVMVVFAIVALLLTSLLRARLAIRYEWWRIGHGVLASLIMLIGLAHVFRVQHYVSTPARMALFGVLALAPIGLLLHVRVVRPWMGRKRRYRVVSVTRERERVWTVDLEADGHGSFSFRPGQFAWVTFGDSAFDVQQHPFTIASSAAVRGRLSFTVKALGDFTSRFEELVRPGMTGFVEGPAGNFCVPDEAECVVFVVGGIGVTPAMSYLRTLRDACAAGRGDGFARKIAVVYGNASLEKAVFRDELASMCDGGVPGLRVVHVPEVAPEGWNGPSGYIDRGVLAGELSEEELGAGYFMLCGPDEMMTGVRSSLRGLGVDGWRIRAERFNVV